MGSGFSWPSASNNTLCCVDPRARNHIDPNVHYTQTKPITHEAEMAEGRAFYQHEQEFVKKQEEMDVGYIF